MHSISGRWMIITDEQIPFEHPRALAFLKYCKSHFRIPDANVLHVGDELDEYWGGMYEKGAEFEHTPNSEMAESLEKLKLRYEAFPLMKLAISNHGTRWIRKAFHAGIPIQLMKRYEEAIQAPVGWVWRDKWLVRAKHPFLVEHGDRFGGQYPHVTAAVHNGISTVIGHFHSIAGIHHIRTQDFHPEFESGFDIWGACGGCLIDFPKYAFQYAHKQKKKPKLGIILVFDDGKWPMWVPLE